MMGPGIPMPLADPGTCRIDRHPACRDSPKGSDMGSDPHPWWMKVGQLVVSAVNALAQLLDAIHHLR